MCSACPMGPKPGSSGSRASIARWENASAVQAGSRGSEAQLHLSLSPRVALGWSALHSGPGSPYLLVGDNDIP